MTTRVPIRYGGTGANTAEAARTSLGAAPSIAYDQANTAYGQANAARSDANTTFAAINTTFGTINTNITTANSQANLAYAQANAAIAAANNANLLLGGVITGTLNVTQDIIVGGNVYLEGNTTFINVATYAVEDSLIYLASNNQLTDSVDIGFMGGKNTGGTYAHTGFVRDATDAKWKLFDGLPEEGHVGNVVNFNNTYLATLVANVEANTLSVVNGVSGNVNFDSGTLFVDSVSNNVGIGTTNPLANLHVASTFQVGNGSNFGNRFTINDDLSAGKIPFAIRDSSNGDDIFSIWLNSTTGEARLLADDDQGVGFMTFYMNANERMRITNAGNVGIGTTNPAYKLDLVGSSATFQSRFGTSTTNFGIWVNDADNFTSCGSITNDQLRFFTNAVDRVTIDAVGNVGIGTTNPVEKLQVTGGIKITGAATIASGSGTGLFLDYASNIGRITALDQGVAWRSLRLNAADIGFQIADADVVRITSGGNVGVGITTPGAKLTVSGEVRISSSGAINTHLNYLDGGDNYISMGNAGATYFRNSSATLMTILGGGNVGIGTNSPTARLNIFGTGSANDPCLALDITTSSAFIHAQESFAPNITSGQAVINAIGREGTTKNSGYIGYLYSGTPGSNNNKLTFGHWGADHLMVMDGAGNVGIGTTSPAHKLDVIGNVRTSSYYLFNGNASNPGDATAAFYDQSGIGPSISGLNVVFRSGSTPIERVRIDSSGNVGVGSTTPTNKLDVLGGITSREYIPAGSGSTYDWNGVIVQYYWTKIANLTGPDAYATLLIQGKLDVNYASYVAGLLTLSRFNNSHMSVQLDSISALDRAIEVRLDNNNDVWLKIEVEWNSSKTWSIINKIGSPTIYWTGLTEQLTTPANSILIRPGEQVRATQGAATSATVTNSGYSYAGSMVVRGSVGIGTAPTSRLTISTSGADGIQLTADGGVSNRLFFTHNGGAATGVTLLGANSRTEGVLRFYTGATPGANSGALRTEFSMTGIGLGGTASPPDGVGIAFPASQSASSDANTLDDYEEGTWTPELRDGGTVLTQSYSYRSGVYHKIGRMVHIHFGFLLSSLSGTSTNVLSVYGLPFVGATTGGYQEPMGYAIMGNQPTASHSNAVYFFNVSGTSILQARLLTGSDTVFTSDNIDGNTFMKFSMIYWV